MKAFSALLAHCAGNSPGQRPVTRNFDVFLICVWINGSPREAGDLRRYRAHYDVTDVYNKDCSGKSYSLRDYICVTKLGCPLSTRTNVRNKEYFQVVGNLSIVLSSKISIFSCKYYFD